MTPRKVLVNISTDIDKSHTWKYVRITGHGLNQESTGQTRLIHEKKGSDPNGAYLSQNHRIPIWSDFWLQY
jgi:hypothetical protein